jgi:hypothetical protein
VPTSIPGVVVVCAYLVVRLRSSTGITRKRTTKSSCIHPQPNSQGRGLKTTTRKLPRKAPKITKKKKRDRQQKALRNHIESSIHTKKGSYKV